MSRAVYLTAPSRSSSPGLKATRVKLTSSSVVHHPHNMLVSAWLLSALPTLALAASAKYDKYRSIAQRNGGLVSLDAAGYDELTTAPREYSVSVVLTALGDAVKCGPCKCVYSTPSPFPSPPRG